jgi:hypothetical protein
MLFFVPFCLDGASAVEEGLPKSLDVKKLGPPDFSPEGSEGSEGFWETQIELRVHQAFLGTNVTFQSLPDRKG